MKKWIIAAAAALSFATPLAAGEAAAHERGRGHDRHHYDRGHDRHYDDDDRDERRAYRHGYRDGYRHDRWDGRRYNGYYYQNNWHYGPPPSAYYGHPGYRPGYVEWRRGHRLPSYYRERYVVVRDYRPYGLYAPPRGHHWVRDDRGDYLLVGIATGVILGVILGD